MVEEASLGCRHGCFLFHPGTVVSDVSFRGFGEGLEHFAVCGECVV